MQAESPDSAAKIADAKRRKKRLSRKEQKARKRLKTAIESAASKDQEENKTSTPGNNESDDGRYAVGASVSEVTARNDEEDYASNYVATPIPSGPHNSQQQHQSAKSLGKWFPKAVVLKALAPPSPQHKACIVLFYQYVNPMWPESYLSTFIDYLCQIAQRRCLGGRIRVAREGVNATLSSRDTDTASARQTLRHLARDLQGYNRNVFGQTDFKYIDDLTGDRHFKDFKVFPVQELVFYGLPSDKTVGGEMDLGSMKGGVYLSPQDFHEKLTDPDTVVVDVRNHYESLLGRFDGQEHPRHDKKEAKSTESSQGASVSECDKTKPQGDDGDPTNEEKKRAAITAAAEYIDPHMRKSTDWTRWLEQDDTQKKLQGKQVLLYCTGGIRCERASVYLNHKMGDKVKGIYQLKGGIERYFKAFPDGGHWRGRNFVFDKREAVDVHNPDGVGGVISNEKKSPEIPDAKCCRCDIPWDRYVGKKKCITCGVPVLVCDVCLSQIGCRKEEEAKLRCPLCVEENVTVAAKDVEFTENGMAGKAKKEVDGHAAPSVLKWGGGHASLKKDKRRFQRKPCRFGADCKRKDCFFAHPKVDSKKEKSL